MSTISSEAARIRASLERETVDESVSVADEREAWERSVVRSHLPDEMVEQSLSIAGVGCLRIGPSAPESGRTILYAHGGGLTTGSVNTHSSFCIELVEATRLPLVSVDYRLLPEHPFPAPVNDIVAVAGELDGDLVFAGDSSGASLMLSAVVELRRSGQPLPTHIVSISGAFDSTLSGSSMDTAPDPQLSRPVLENWQKIISQACDPADPMVSPLFADLAGLPPALLLAGGDEVWRSDSERMHEQLLAHDVESTLVIHEGMWHAWPLAGDFPEARAALQQIDAFLDV